MIKQREKTLKVYISFGDLESAGQWMKYEIKVLDYKIEKDKSSNFKVLTIQISLFALLLIQIRDIQ